MLFFPMRPAAAAIQEARRDVSALGHGYTPSYLNLRLVRGAAVQLSGDGSRNVLELMSSAS